jgi:hypothetical protein
MDKARPFGVVFSDDHAADLMSAEIAPMFSGDEVCIRGISEQAPLPIYITGAVIINPLDREPASESKYHRGEKTTLSVQQVRELDSFGFRLPRAPRSHELPGVFVEFADYGSDGKKTGHVMSLEIEEGRVEDHPGGFVFYVPMRRVKDAIKKLPSAAKFLMFDLTTDVTFIPYCRVE